MHSNVILKTNASTKRAGLFWTLMSVMETSDMTIEWEATRQAGCRMVDKFAGSQVGGEELESTIEHPLFVGTHSQVRRIGFQ
jgi:hypothetical protein